MFKERLGLMERYLDLYHRYRRLVIGKGRFFCLRGGLRLLKLGNGDVDDEWGMMGNYCSEDISGMLNFSYVRRIILPFLMRYKFAELIHCLHVNELQKFGMPFGIK